jgi:hypothetical protein
MYVSLHGKGMARLTDVEGFTDKRSVICEIVRREDTSAGKRGFGNIGSNPSCVKCVGAMLGYPACHIM